MAGFIGYGDYSLLDVYQWSPGFSGIVMLCPAGFHETFIFDCQMMAIPYGMRAPAFPAIHMLSSP
jgi:hypothetical protein